MAAGTRHQRTERPLEVLAPSQANEMFVPGEHGQRWPQQPLRPVRLTEDAGLGATG